MHDLDCILIGYNDVDLAWVDEELKPLQSASGGYRHFRSNTVSLGGERVHFTELLNRSIAEATGDYPSLHVAQTPSLACCILKSFMAHRGLRTEIVNFFNADRDRLVDLLAQKPRAVAITTTVYTTARPVVEIVECIRRCNADTTIIVGGPHIYNVCSDHDAETRDFLLGEMGADVYVFDSQGELTLSTVVAALGSARPDLSRIPNLIYTGDGVTFTETRRVPENNALDDTNIDWPLFDPGYVTPFAWMRTARSCAYSCAFCRYPALGGPLVLNSVEVVERQVRYLAERGLQHLYFIDDTFNVPLPRFKDLCRMMIANKFGVTWTSYFRIGNADEETFDLIAAAGCRAVFAGVESGDQQVLKNMNKKAMVQTYRQGLRLLAERDIAVYASFIVGFPGETAASVQNTIDFIQETAPTFYSAEAYFHDPKVPVQQRAAEFGLRGAGYSWTHDTMGWEEAQDHVERLHRTVDRSVLLPLYGMDVWSVPYLEGNGISRSQLLEFLRTAQAMVVRSFDEDQPDYTQERARLRDLFSPAVA